MNTSKVRNTVSRKLAETKEKVSKFLDGAEKVTKSVISDNLGAGKQLWLSKKRKQQKKKLKELHQQTHREQCEDAIKAGTLDRVPRWNENTPVNRELFTKRVADKVSKCKLEWETATNRERKKCDFIRNGNIIHMFSMPFFNDPMSDEREEITWADFKNKVFYTYLQNLEQNVALVDAEIDAVRKIELAFKELREEQEPGKPITYGALHKRLQSYGAFEVDSKFWADECWSAEHQDEAVSKDEFLRKHGSKRSLEELEALKQELEEASRLSVNARNLPLTASTPAAWDGDALAAIIEEDDSASSDDEVDDGDDSRILGLSSTEKKLTAAGDSAAAPAPAPAPAEDGKEVKEGKDSKGDKDGDKDKEKPKGDKDDGKAAAAGGLAGCGCEDATKLAGSSKDKEQTKNSKKLAACACGAAKAGKSKHKAGCPCAGKRAGASAGAGADDATAQVEKMVEDAVIQAVESEISDVSSSTNSTNSTAKPGAARVETAIDSGKPLLDETSTLPGFPQADIAKLWSSLSKFAKSILRKLVLLAKTKPAAATDASATAATAVTGTATTAATATATTGSSDAKLAGCAASEDRKRQPANRPPIDVAKLLLQNNAILFAHERDRLTLELEQEKQKYAKTVKKTKKEEDKKALEEEFKAIEAKLLEDANRVRDQFVRLEAVFRANYRREIKKLRSSLELASGGSECSPDFKLVSAEAFALQAKGITGYYSSASSPDLPPAVDYSSELHEPYCQGSEDGDLGYIYAAKLMKEWQEFRNIQLLDRMSASFLKAALKEYNPQVETHSLLDILEILMTVGIATEKVFDAFLEKRDRDSAKNRARMKSHAAQFMIDQFLKVLDLQNLKLALWKYGPLLITLPVYNQAAVSFWQPINKRDKPLGYHTMLIVAYDDARKAITVRNSLGKTWGRFGNCDIPYDEVFQQGQIIMCIDGDSRTALRAKTQVIVNPLQSSKALLQMKQAQDPADDE